MGVKAAEPGRSRKARSGLGPQIALAVVGALIVAVFPIDDLPGRIAAAGVAGSAVGYLLWYLGVFPKRRWLVVLIGIVGAVGVTLTLREVELGPKPVVRESSSYIGQINVYGGPSPNPTPSMTRGPSASPPAEPTPRPQQPDKISPPNPVDEVALARIQVDLNDAASEADALGKHLQALRATQDPTTVDENPDLQSRLDSARRSIEDGRHSIASKQLGAARVAIDTARTRLDALRRMLGLGASDL